MAKKKKKEKPEVAENKSKKPIPWIIGAILVAIMLLLVSRDILFSGSGDKKGESFQGSETRPLLNTSSSSGDKKGKSFYLQEKETKPVLNPSMFTGVIRSAYAAAEKYPEVFNEVFCYCYCENPPFNHKTLLSCFTDKHGAG